MSVLIYRPQYSRDNPYRGFKFVEAFGDFLGDRINNTDMIVGELNFYMEDVKDSENVVFQDLLESYGLIQHVGCPTHQSGHTSDLIVIKERDTFRISDHVDKLNISDHQFYLEIGVNQPQAVRRTRRMRLFGRGRNKKRDEIDEVIKGKSSIDNGVGIYNDRVKGLFDRIFPEIECYAQNCLCWSDLNILGSMGSAPEGTVLFIYVHVY